MRNPDDIQRAHDTLVCLFLDTDYPRTAESKEWLPKLIAAASALCWVLEHDHNTKLTELLELAERELAARGMVITGPPETIQ